MKEEGNRVQTYRGSSISSTLEDIQRELGEEALVVSVREIPAGPAWQVWRQQEVEVQVLPPPDQEAGLLDEAPKEASSAAEALFAAVKGPASSAAGSDEVQLSEEHKEEIRPDFSVLDDIKMQLKRQGLDRDLIEKIFKTALSTINTSHWNKPDIIRPHLKEQLSVVLKAYNSLRLQKDRIIFLIGPRGAGKTTTTAKLALYFKEDLKQKVTWICADTVRAASVDEARIYCDTLGFDLKLAYTPHELEKLIRESEDSDVVLVDTPGFNPYLESDVLQVGKFLTAVPGRSIYILAPATVKESDLEDIAAAFEPFQPDSLVLTKLDETGSYGSIFNFAYRSGIPLAYYTSGPDVFNDLRPANPARLVDAMMGEVRFR